MIFSKKEVRLEELKEKMRVNKTPENDPDRGDEHLMFKFWLGLPKPEKEEEDE